MKKDATGCAIQISLRIKDQVRIRIGSVVQIEAEQHLLLPLSVSATVQFEYRSVAFVLDVASRKGCTVQISSGVEDQPCVRDSPIGTIGAVAETVQHLFLPAAIPLTVHFENCSATPVADTI